MTDLSQSGDLLDPLRNWDEAVEKLQRDAMIRRGRLVVADCGHPQDPPTALEIDNCPEVIVRRCLVCECELWWNIDRWKKV